MTNSDRPDLRGDYPELAKSLETASQQSLITDIQRGALYALDNFGTSSFLNGLPARVSLEYTEIQNGKKQLYARLAQYSNNDSRRLDVEREVLFVFDEDPNVAVRSANPNALRVRQIAGVPSLIVDNDLDPILDDARYLELAKTIVDGIAAKNLNRDSQDKINQRKRRENRRATAQLAGFGLALSTALYGHVPFGNEDAQIGPIPMPSFVEFFVDWNNRSDHNAQGYEKPAGAAVVQAAADSVIMPLIANFDTSDVPSAFYSSDWLAENDPGNNKWHSKPGLYEVDHGWDDHQCIAIEGNFTGETTSVFTQTELIREHITIEAVSGDQAVACNDSDGTIEGSFFIWQDK